MATTLTKPVHEARTLESWMLLNGKAGDAFYTEKTDKDMTARATYYNRQIKTERIIAVKRDVSIPTCILITRIILQ